MTITINHKDKQYIYILNADIQQTPNGRPFRLSGTRRESNHIIHRFIFLDERAGFIEFNFDQNNKHYETNIF